MFTKVLWNKVGEVLYLLLSFINLTLWTGNDQDVYKTSVIQRINCFEKDGLFCLFLTSSSFSRKIMVHRDQKTMAHPALSFQAITRITSCLTPKCIALM
jgi:hypothetical protein